jgi:anti-sigma factor RsiW
MSCQFADRDGSYVLGALSSAERLEFERHLAGCAECSRAVRELAGLPGLLSRVDGSVLERPPEDPPVPPTLLPALLREVRRTRRRRTTLTAALAAAAAVVALLVPTVTGLLGDRTTTASTPPDRPPAATSTGSAMVPVGNAPVRATLVLASVTWGTRLDLTCTYVPHEEDYHGSRAVTYGLFVRTREGRTEKVGTWRSIEGRTMRLSAATAAPRRDIASVEVRTADGMPVLELTA